MQEPSVMRLGLPDSSSSASSSQLEMGGCHVPGGGAEAAGPSCRDLAFLLLPAAKVDDDLLTQCANLFSNHYGFWGPNPGKMKPGSRVKMSAERLRSQCLHDSKRCFVVAAIHPATDEVVGHVFYTRFFYAPGQGDVLWITQLVVHKSWRGVGVGRRLCRLAWDGENTFACGVVSAHPLAVRCVERMAGARCSVPMTKLHGLRMAAASGLDFVARARLVVSKSTAVLRTDFFVDRTEVDELVAKLPDWQLGRLQDGEEYFAFCFPAPKPSLARPQAEPRGLFQWLACCFGKGPEI